MAPIDAGVFQLRPYATEDADELVRASRESVATVGRWMPWCHADYVAAEALEWIAHTSACLADRSAFELALVSKEDGRLIGGAGLNQFNVRNNFCNLGYWVRQSWQRRGAASASARALANFGFAHLLLSRIEIVVQDGNVASQRVAENAGARREGLARNRLFILGQPVDAVMYALVP
jgi:RimJ/RimL family protein N-acetyltransferase